MPVNQELTARLKSSVKGDATVLLVQRLSTMCRVDGESQQRLIHQAGWRGFQKSLLRVLTVNLEATHPAGALASHLFVAVRVPVGV